MLLGFSAKSQDILKGKDLSQIKVDMISAEDLNKLKSQLTASGMTPDQAEQLAISKGMLPTEAAKLKLKLANTSTNPESKATTSEKNNTARENNEPELLEKNNKKATLINPMIFGSELYREAALSFEPNLKLATPLNYILGPEDQLIVSVYGVQEYNGNLTVSPDGTISIPNVGEIKVAGLTIEAATQKLKNIMGNGVYSYLKSGGSKLSVSLGKIRTISITIIGSNKPGNYRVSSLSSIFNALFIAGGPSRFGSFREIELLRNNKVERKIDLYRFLVDGNQSDNISLKDNDVIRIPAYKTRIELKGEVKRPGIFEVLPSETLSKILNYASGFTDEAYMNSVKVFQRNDTEKQIQDLQSSQFGVYIPKSGDVVEVSKILDRYRNRITIKGAVFRPEQYELVSNMHIADLIKRADGLKPDAYSERGQLVRLNDNLSKTFLSFDISKALNGDPTNNHLLQKDDEVIISSVSDLKDKFQITIQGEVRNPGKFEFFDKITLKDLILQAGGFTDAAYKNVEIARLLKRDSLIATDINVTTIIKTEINNQSLSLIGGEVITLLPFDVITVRKLPGYQIPESVLIDGQVQFPGPYTLGNSQERVSDILKRAGGFSPDAYPEGAYVKRYKNIIEKERSKEAFEKLKKASNDSTDKLETDILRDFDKIPLSMNKILKNPGGMEDFLLKSKDEIYIPKFDGQVKISGEVLLNTQIPFDSDKSLKYYISSAGGFTSNALKKKTYVVYANGRAEATSSFLFFKSYPKLEPGCELIVPKKREKRASNTAEIIGIASAVASLAGVTLAILKL